MSGTHEVRRVQIEPAVIGEDREMLEDLIAAAMNDAVHSWRPPPRPRWRPRWAACSCRRA